MFNNPSTQVYLERKSSLLGASATGRWDWKKTSFDVHDQPWDRSLAVIYTICSATLLAENKYKH